MATTASAAADRERFRAFLREHRYAPQGRLARAGELQDRDLDALMRPGVAPVWRWVWQNLRSAEELERVARSVRVAQRQLASSQRERREASREVERLEARKAHTLEALRKARERECALLASLAAVEDEKRAQAGAAADHKQRRALQRAFMGQSDATAAQVIEHVDRVRQVATRDGAPPLAVEATGESRESPVDVLLREYLRLLNASSAAESVEFGDRDVEHVRQFGGPALLRWLREAASRPVDSAAAVRGDDTDAQYAAHVEDRAVPTRDALDQVRAHLRRHQKQHIARFVDAQAAYARAAHLRRELADDGVEMATDSLVAQTVALEESNAVERAALTEAVDTYAKAMERVEAARARKLELERQLEMVDSFERRQQHVIDHIRAMHAENQRMMGVVAARQMELRAYARERLLERFGGGRSERLLQQRRTLLTEELRQLASVRQRLDESLDRAFVQSVAIAGGGDDSGGNGAARPVQSGLLLPFAEFSINQLKHDNTGDRGGACSTGLDRVFRALEVPPYGNWDALLQRLNALEERSSTDRVEAEVDSAAAALTRELQEEERGDAAHTKARASALVDELRRVSETMETASFPLLEEAKRANRETSDRIVPRLRELADDLASQRGWSINI